LSARYALTGSLLSISAFLCADQADKPPGEA
jgi:hypothetical protein